MKSIRERLEVFLEELEMRVNVDKIAKYYYTRLMKEVLIKKSKVKFLVLAGDYDQFKDYTVRYNLNQRLYRYIADESVLKRYPNYPVKLYGTYKEHPCYQIIHQYCEVIEKVKW
jgi:hypothetical protein